MFKVNKSEFNGIMTITSHPVEASKNGQNIQKNKKIDDFLEVHTHTHSDTHTNTHTHTHTHSDTHTHIHTHTHTQTTHMCKVKTIILLDRICWLYCLVITIEVYIFFNVTIILCLLPWNCTHMNIFFRGTHNHTCEAPIRLVIKRGGRVLIRPTESKIMKKVCKTQENL